MVRPGRGVAEVTKEFDLEQEDCKRLADSTLSFMKTNQTVSRQAMALYNHETFTFLSTTFLERNGSRFFGRYSRARWIWPEGANELVSRLADMMIRQWAFQVEKERGSDSSKRSRHSDNDWIESARKVRRTSCEGASNFGDTVVGRSVEVSADDDTIEVLADAATRGTCSSQNTRRQDAASTSKTSEVLPANSFRHINQRRPSTTAQSFQSLQQRDRDLTATVEADVDPRNEASSVRQETEPIQLRQASRMSAPSHPSYRERLQSSPLAGVLSSSLSSNPLSQSALSGRPDNGELLASSVPSISTTSHLNSSQGAQQPADHASVLLKFPMQGSSDVEISTSKAGIVLQNLIDMYHGRLTAHMISSNQVGLPAAEAARYLGRSQEAISVLTSIEELAKQN